MVYRPFCSEDAIAAASAALSRAWAQSVAIDTVQSLGGEVRRNLILRARATADAMDPRSIIIKATRAATYDRNAAEAYAMSGFVKEWAAASVDILPRLRTCIITLRDDLRSRWPDTVSLPEFPAFTKTGHSFVTQTIRPKEEMVGSNRVARRVERPLFALDNP